MVGPFKGDDRRGAISRELNPDPLGRHCMNMGPLGVSTWRPRAVFVRQVRQELDAKEDDGEVEVAADDGAFWMCYDDFLNHFVSVTVCYAHVPQPGRALPNTKMAPTPWRPELETRLKSSFTSPSGGGALRPTHLFEIVVGPADAKADDAEVTVLLGMHQARPSSSAMDL